MCYLLIKRSLNTCNKGFIDLNNYFKIKSTKFVLQISFREWKRIANFKKFFRQIFNLKIRHDDVKFFLNGNEINFADVS